MRLWRRVVRCAVLSSMMGAAGTACFAQEPAVSAAPQRLEVSSVADAQPKAADPLIEQVNEALHANAQRFLVANHHSPWQIFHGLLAYRQDFILKVGDQKQSALEWIASADPRFDNRPLFLVSAQGVKFHPYTRPYAFEGHQSQTLALLSESGLPLETTFKASGRDVTLEQLFQSTMLDVNAREETTWVLWAMINYYDVDKQWTNRWGQPWSMEALVRSEVAAHTPTRPCGGNHNLFALARARDKYVATGRPLRGTWFEADQKLRQYIELARSMQNSDGTFSSNFYKGPGFTQDMNSRFNTTGHTMEFLAVALPDNRLNEPWVRNAVNMLSRELLQHRRASVDCGPLYHSLNALRIYRDRVAPPLPETSLALATPSDPATTASPGDNPPESPSTTDSPSGSASTGTATTPVTTTPGTTPSTGNRGTLATPRPAAVLPMPAANSAATTATKPTLPVPTDTNPPGDTPLPTTPMPTTPVNPPATGAVRTGGTTSDIPTLPADASESGRSNRLPVSALAPLNR